MASDLDANIIKRTQDTLGKYVKKPHLTEKLLKRPPFGFLYDVFRVVIRDTECFVGLYTPEELVYENIKDREGKIKFLQKMIDVVKLTTNSNLAIRTSKIVAGHEPEKTNELLQLMGEIIEKKLNWQAAVETVLAGKPKESSRKIKDNTTKISKDAKDKEKSKEKDPKTKDSKPTKTSSKSSVASTNKVKEKYPKKVSSKEKSSKESKVTEKSTKKLVKESTTTKTKLSKSLSQTSSKSSPSPPSIKKTKVVAAFNEDDECKHEEMGNQEEVETKVSTPPTKPPVDNIVNELINTNEIIISNSNLEEEVEMVSKEIGKQRLSSGKTKKSSEKSRKTIGNKRQEENSLETKENINSLEIANDLLTSQEKAADVATNESKVHIKEETTDRTQQEEKLKEKQINHQIEVFSPLKQKPIRKLASSPPSPPQTNSNNEIKRENTFTRENSKDSSSNQSSLVNRPRTSLRPPSARPPSARPGAPRRRDKNIEIILQPNDQIKMSGIQVKLETFGDLDDDGDNLVIIENPNAVNDAVNEQQTNLTESEKMMQDETIEQGHLVQQILETQKELVQDDSSGQHKSDKDSTNGLVMRQTSARHMNNLRDVIQNLTKSINPLGKLMDFIPEDIDAMQLELTMWRDTYTQAANELKREKSLTESATEPMKNQLIQIEANIAEYMEMIDASRVKILQNSEKVLKMLTS